MDIQAKASEIRRFCRDHANAKLAEKYSRYFKEGYDAYGLDQKTLEAQRELWFEQWHGELGVDGWLRLGDELVKSGKYEEASFAIVLLAKCRGKFSATVLAGAGRWLENGICNWAHTDVLCNEVLSPVLVEKSVGMEALAEWRSSPSRWKRRAVAVALIKPIKEGTVSVARALKFIAPMMADDERVVQQGLGWMLREAWKLEPKPVEALLLKWKDTCGRVIVQYATEKMTATGKARFRKSKAVGA